VEAIKVGGQALGDGVFMRTERAWAIARADGTVEIGAVPGNRFGAIPILRVIVGLGSALKLGIVKGLVGDRRTRPTARSNKRFLQALLGAEVAVGMLAYLITHSHLPGWLHGAAQIVPWVAVLVALRVAAPAVVWRYHGAEHKAVTAHERGIPMDDTATVLTCPRIHDRCGTNLVFLMAALGIALQGLPTYQQLPIYLVALGACVELLTVAGRWPRSIPSRLMLAGGRFLQAHVTTREPTWAEQEIACVALSAAVAEHERLELADQFDLEASAGEGGGHLVAVLGIPGLEGEQHLDLVDAQP
jgi:uncharacterized protein YqhQ